MLKIRNLAQHFLHLRPELLVEHEDPRAAVAEKVQIVLGKRCRVDGNRHRSDLRGPQKHSDEFRRVWNRHQHALFGLHAKRPQAVSATVDHLR